VEEVGDYIRALRNIRNESQLTALCTTDFSNPHVVAWLLAGMKELTVSPILRNGIVFKSARAHTHQLELKFLDNNMFRY
jgi:hypothetical protein